MNVVSITISSSNIISLSLYGFSAPCFSNSINSYTGMSPSEPTVNEVVASLPLTPFFIVADVAIKDTFL